MDTVRKYFSCNECIYYSNDDYDNKNESRFDRNVLALPSAFMQTKLIHSLWEKKGIQYLKYTTIYVTTDL